MAELIRRQGGVPFVAPSMRETPLSGEDGAWTFAERLFGGSFDMMILLTGVGTRLLAKKIAERHPPEAFPDVLRGMTVVARGPKPVAALREMQVPVTVTVPAPNTWRELLEAVAARPERRVALQEYGVSNVELIAGLTIQGREVTPVRIYGWDLPEDTAPLREAARRLAAGEFDVAFFTTSVQVVHLFRIAAEEGVESGVRDAFRRTIVASIGPTTSEMLDEYGIATDIAPSQPRMGFLVKETADRAVILKEKKQ
ncbi:MAG: uroporphyrinogen-III synthase [Bryobacterales bacterium]|nr:uroporphyrinogen-III synthase [Bryobacterales bacterium]